MTGCLSPNGMNVYRGQAPLTRLLVGTRDGVVVLERQASDADWAVSERVLAGQHISSLLVEPTSGAVVAGVHWGGLYVSEDDGRTWAERSEGIAQQHVFTLRTQTRPTGHARVYAGTEPVSLYWSEDLGRTWHDLPSLRDVPGQENWTFPPPPHVAHLKAVAFDPRDPGLFYVGIEQGALLKTSDGGATWSELTGFSSPGDPIYSDVHQIVLRPSNPAEIFLSTGAGVHYSADQGASWQELTGPVFRVGYPDQLVFSPEDERVLFVAGSRVTPADWRRSRQAHGVVMRSEDSGRTWEPCGQGIPDDLHANIEALGTFSHPAGFALYAGTTDGDIFASEDRGQSWQRIATSVGAVSKVGHYRNLIPAAV